MTVQTGERLLDCAVVLGLMATMWLLGSLALDALRALGVMP